MDRFSDLDLFVRVVRRASLSGAAQELGLTGAAVSKRLAALERRLGVRLIQRTTRRLSVTAEGERYMAEGAGLLAALDELEHGMRGNNAVPAGLLRVNATFGFGRRAIADALASFARRHPALEVQLHLSDRPVNLVEEGFDLGIRIGELADASLGARKLLDNRRILCAAPAYLERCGTPQRIGELARHQAIVLRENEDAYGSWELHNGPATETIKVRGAMSTNDGDTAVRWARDGFGIMLRSVWDIDSDLQSGTLRPVLPDWSLPADIHAVYPTRKQLPAKTRAFIDFLVERYSKGL